MNIRRSAVLLAVLTLGACGGGGGGGSVPPGDGGGNGGGGDGGSDDGGSGGSTTNGTAKIVFPWTHSTATAPTVTIRGIAADPEGVASVSINGVAATIAATGLASPQHVLAKPGLTAGEVEWSAEVELANGDNSLVVSVEDEAGDVTEEVDAATIRYVEVPITSTLDPEATRLVGLSYTLTSSGYAQRLVQHNYETLEQTIFEGDIWTAPSNTCFRRFENEFLYLSFFTGTWELRKFDLTTEQDSLLVEITEADWDPGPGFRPVPFVARLVCDSNHTSAYVLANYTDENGMGYRPQSGFAKSRVMEIDLATGLLTTLSETDTAVNPRWLAQYMTLAETKLVTMEDVNPHAALTSISLADGSRTFLTPGLAVGGLALEPDLNAGRVYVATFEGVDEVDVVQSDKRNISVVEDDHPLVFSEVRSIGFDPANNRVIVGDSDLDALIAIDISTGERSEFLSRKVGTGATLVAPRHFAISADGTRAYVADDGSNAPERLFEIDLATGDRRLVGDISQPFNYVVSGLALDEAGGRAFVSFHHELLEVDLEMEDVQTIASIDSTVLESINGLLLDPDNGRLLVGDFINDGVFALDLATHAIEVVSQPNDMGGGPAFGGLVSMTWGASASELFVAGQTSGAVTRVDLETGDREALAAGCNAGLSPPFDNLDQVLYNATFNELLISGDQLFSLDLESAACNTLPRWVFPLQIRVTPTNQMLGVVFGALVQIDRGTGEVVIVSK